MTFRIPSKLLAVGLAVSISVAAAEACSRATWLGPGDAVVTGRSVDWPYAFNTHFFIFPAPDPQHPNIAPTYWRTVLDHGRKVYYFESALSPNVMWVSLGDIDFSPGSGIRAVSLEGPEGFARMGKINADFKPADNITYLKP